MIEALFQQWPLYTIDHHVRHGVKGGLQTLHVPNPQFPVPAARREDSRYVWRPGAAQDIVAVGFECSEREQNGRGRGRGYFLE